LTFFFCETKGQKQVEPSVKEKEKTTETALSIALLSGSSTQEGTRSV
jgi:hypothetical protein